MADFRIIVDVKNVAEGDAEDVAQQIWDEHALDLDASQGEFTVKVQRVEEHKGHDFATDIDWTPEG